MSKQKRLVILGMFIIGFVLFASNLNGPLLWDDDDWIVGNPFVHAPGQYLGELLTEDVLAGVSQSSNYYRPVLMLSFAFNWAVGDASPFSYHLLSNLLHIGSAILMFLLLSRLLATLRRPELAERTTLWIAAAASLFWLIHPVQPESVAYISGRGDPLSVFFMMLATVLFLRGKGWWLVGSLAAAALAVLSRETAVLLPVYVVLMLMAFVHRERFWVSLKRSLIAVWPFFALSAIYGLARLTLLNFANTLNWHRFENVYTESVFVRVWTFLSALVEYVRITLVPTGLHMEHDIAAQLSPGHWTVLLGLALLIAAVVWVVLAWRRGNRIPFFGVGMFLIPLGPASGILAPINSMFYEHWLYLSLFGAAVLLSYYGAMLWQILRTRSRMLGNILLILALVYGGWFAVQTVQRNYIWTNAEQLYDEILQYEPDNVRVLNNLANIYADRNEPDRAQEYWLRASEADPTQPAPYHNLGNLARDRGEYEKAEELYLRAISTQKTFHYAYRNLAGILLTQERYTEALQVLTALRDLVPADPAIHYTIAQVLHVLGEDALAREALDVGRRTTTIPEALQAFDELERQLQ